jgi:hypothetical protein
LGGVSFEKLVNFVERENPFFSIKRVLSLHTSLSPKRTTKDLVGLWTLDKMIYLWMF